MLISNDLSHTHMDAVHACDLDGFAWRVGGDESADGGIVSDCVPTVRAIAAAWKDVRYFWDYAAHHGIRIDFQDTKNQPSDDAPPMKLSNLSAYERWTLADSPDIEPNVAEELARFPDFTTRRKLAGNVEFITRHASPKIVTMLASDPDDIVRGFMARWAKLPPAIQRDYAANEIFPVRLELAKYGKPTDPVAIKHLAAAKEDAVRIALWENMDAELSLVQDELTRSDFSVLVAAARHPSLDERWQQWMVKLQDPRDGRLAAMIAHRDDLSEKTAELIRQTYPGPEGARVRLGLHDMHGNRFRYVPRCERMTRGEAPVYSEQPAKSQDGVSLTYKQLRSMIAESLAKRGFGPATVDMDEQPGIYSNQDRRYESAAGQMMGYADILIGRTSIMTEESFEQVAARIEEMTEIYFKENDFWEIKSVTLRGVRHCCSAEFEFNNGYQAFANDIELGPDADDGSTVRGVLAGALFKCGGLPSSPEWREAVEKAAWSVAWDIPAKKIAEPAAPVKKAFRPGGKSAAKSESKGRKL